MVSEETGRAFAAMTPPVTHPLASYSININTGPVPGPVGCSKCLIDEVLHHAKQGNFVVGHVVRFEDAAKLFAYSTYVLHTSILTLTAQTWLWFEQREPVAATGSEAFRQRDSGPLGLDQQPHVARPKPSIRLRMRRRRTHDP